MKRSRSSRREFLQGRSVLKAIQDSLEPRSAKPPFESSDHPDQTDGGSQRQSNYLEQYSQNAMACEFELLFNLQQYPQAAQMALRAHEIIAQLEAQLSIYRPDSELSEINRSALQQPLAIESRLLELLELAKEISESTGGAFDVTANPLSKLWGFDARAGNLPSPEDIAKTLDCIGSKFIEVNHPQSTVRITNPQTQIDLRGIGKGHALDRVAELFEESEINDWILHGGQSSVIARGHCLRANDDSDGWRVGLTHPTIPGKRLAEVILRDQTLGTSGTARQGFFHQGVRYGHIIDPRTGWPTTHCLSTTVIARSAAVSDALATAFFVMATDEVEAYCKNNLDVSAILILPGKSSGNTEIVWFNLEEGDWIRY